jgi:hypothetical protein
MTYDRQCPWRAGIILRGSMVAHRHELGYNLVNRHSGESYLTKYIQLERERERPEI